MNEKLLFLQSLYTFMEKEGITCSFTQPPKADCLFFDLFPANTAAACEVLQKIAECLRKDTSDFFCIEEIIALVENYGLSTTPRHDF